MNKKSIIFLISAIFLASFRLAHAGLSINEVMYDLKTGSDSGREWAEIYNDGDSAVDAATFSFFEADTNHKLTSVEGGTNIPSHSFAVIVSDPKKFKIDWPNYSGIILDSTFSLNNSGEALAIKKGDDVIDQYSYDSGAGSGNGMSVGKINGGWKETQPTPGAENKIAPPASKKTAAAKKVSAQSEEEVSSAPAERFQNKKFTADFEPIPEENSNLFFYIIILALILLGSGVGVYFLRKDSSEAEISDSFEILEE